LNHRTTETGEEKNNSSALCLRASVVNIYLMQNRIDVFEQMLASDPSNTMVMFGLAKEYEKVGDYAKVIEMLDNYLAKADDEGNAYGVLAHAYAQSGDREKAVEIYRRGIDVSMAHGHPSMANEYKMTLDLDFESETI